MTDVLKAGQTSWKKEDDHPEDKVIEEEPWAQRQRMMVPEKCLWLLQPLSMQNALLSTMGGRLAWLWSRRGCPEVGRVTADLGPFTPTSTGSGRDN